MYSRGNIDTGSEVPGGSFAHRPIAKGVSRQIQGVLEQSAAAHVAIIARAVTLIADITSTLADEYDTKVLQQLDDLQLRLAEDQRELAQVSSKLTDVRSRVPGCRSTRWYGADPFTAHFRGEHRRLRTPVPRPRAALRRLRSGARHRLRARRVPRVARASSASTRRASRSTRARRDGASVAASTSSTSRARVEYLERLEDGSLGGLVMIQVIEHLSPQHVVDVVRFAADKVRPGGRVVVETVNPTSLYTYAHAFWVDPDHVRPGAPDVPRFLFAEAGFASVERVDRSPVPADESLELLPGDDELVEAAQRELRAHQRAAVRPAGLRHRRDAGKPAGSRPGRRSIRSSSAASPGDAITNFALGIRDLLRQVGPSEIYARHIAPESRTRSASSRTTRRAIRATCSCSTRRSVSRTCTSSC